MAYSFTTLFVAIISICSLCHLVSSKPTKISDFKTFGCWETKNASISYQNNVNLLFSNFESTSSMTFYNYTSTGDVPDKVFGYYMCRGDVSPEVCHSCILNGTKFAQDANCKYQDGAFFADECMFKYTNRSTYGTLEQVLGVESGPLGEKVSNYKEYNQTLSAVLESVVHEATLGEGAKPGFATKEANVTGNETIYSLAQCTPDILGINCTRCLTNAVSVLRMDAAGYDGGSYKRPNCQLTYENELFYNLGGQAHSKGDQLMPSSIVPAFCSILILFMHSFILLS